MAKKTRHARRQPTRKSAPRTSSTAKARPSVKASEGAPLAPAQAVAPPNWREEYRYVYGDLKRIGILAGTMFLVLAILAVVLR